MTRLDFFCSPIGLGHVTRDIAIADNLENLSANFVTGSGAAEILRKTNRQVEDVYNPPSFIVEDGSLKSPARWLWNYYRYYKDCKNISESILQKSNPSLVVSDEDFASLRAAQQRKIPTILVTDILETRFTKGPASFVEKRMNRSMNQIIKRCDAVILPEDGDDCGNIKRVGPIVRETRHTREELREKFGLCKKTIVISIGGTDAGLFLIQRAIDAASKTSQDLQVIVVSGPSVGKKFEGARNFGFVENLHELIFAADLVISLAGRSTIDEARAYGTPGIFIPIRGHFEQEDNARQEGYEFADAFRLEKIIPSKLEERRSRADAKGAKKAAEIIQKTIQ